jgi:hypothetical protein
VSTEEFDQAPVSPFLLRMRAYEVVQAILSDDHNYERGVEAARAVTGDVLAETGAAGLTELVVELSLKLGDALERIAAEQGVAAVDLADVWFVD